MHLVPPSCVEYSGTIFLNDFNQDAVACEDLQGIVSS